MQFFRICALVVIAVVVICVKSDNGFGRPTSVVTINQIIVVVAKNLVETCATLPFKMAGGYKVRHRRQKVFFSIPEVSNNS